MSIENLENKLITALDRCAFDKGQEFCDMARSTRERNNLNIHNLSATNELSSPDKQNKLAENEASKITQDASRIKVSLDLGKKTNAVTPDPAKTIKPPNRTLNR